MGIIFLMHRQKYWHRTLARDQLIISLKFFFCLQAIQVSQMVKPSSLKVVHALLAAVVYTGTKRSNIRILCLLVSLDYQL